MGMQGKVTTSRRKEGEVMHDDAAGVTPLVTGTPMQGVRHD